MTYRNVLFKQCLELARQPVSVAAYAGEDVRFSTEFEALEAELGKGQSMHASGQVDWIGVRESTEHILRHRSKDLRVAVWFVWALHQCESYPGLLAGISMLRSMCTEQWDFLHPQKNRTRAGAIEWLVVRLDRSITDVVPVKDQLPLFRDLAYALGELDTLLTRNLGQEAPLILPIHRRLTGMVQRAEEGNADAGTGVGAIVTQAKQLASQLLQPGVSINSEKEAHKALRAQQESAQHLCAWWLRQRATDLRALRLNRTMMWMSIDGLPECNSEQVTALRGLPADKLKGYYDRFEREDFADLLVDVESSLARSPFWLDGQRLAWECLQGLKAHSAMREVEVHCGLFLQRLPGVIELFFHDRVPFADGETRSWISTHVMPQVQTTVPAQQVRSADVRGPWEEALQGVGSTLRRDGLKPAVRVLKQGLQSAHGGRERFFWQLSLARLCFQAKRYELAKRQLEMLDQQMHQAGLHAWEPDVALEVLRLLHGCFDLLPQGQAVREQKEDVYRRLCHLDLEVVLE